MISRAKMRIWSLLSILSGFVLGIFQSSPAKAGECPPGAAIAAGVVQLGPDSTNPCVATSDVIKDPKKLAAIIQCIQGYRGTEPPTSSNIPTLDDLIWCELQVHGAGQGELKGQGNR